MSEENATPTKAARSGLSGWQVAGIAFGVTVVTLVVGSWAVMTYVFPTRLEPVALSVDEKQALRGKLQRLGVRPDDVASGLGDEGLVPEPYSEDAADRRVEISERELNALLAHNTDLAERFAIDLSGDLVSGVLLVPVPEDFPVVGGRTLKVRMGVVLAFRDKRPVVELKGVSVMGVPLPNSWLGGLKNVDLVEQYGAEGPWKAFAEGIRALRIEEGALVVEVAE